MTSNPQESNDAGHMSKIYSDKTYPAAYHLITDVDKMPIARLLILFDKFKRPGRAELHIDADATQRDEEIALEQAKSIINTKYSTDNPAQKRLEVRILHAEQRQANQHFPIPARESGLSYPWLGDSQSRQGLILAAAALLMIVIGAAWGLSALLSRTTNNPSPSSNDVVASSDVASESLPTVPPAILVDPSLPQTNGLPASQNANASLALGQRVKVTSGAALTLRTQPGASAGETVGYMQNEEQATIVGGPFWVEGNSDTIVWWYVETSSGIRAWAPANDSNFTLLEPAPAGG